jgi:hypothetical protein
MLVILAKRNKDDMMSSPGSIVSQKEEIYKEKRKHKEQRYKKLIQDIENIDDWANYSTNNGLLKEVERRQNPEQTQQDFECIYHKLQEARNFLDQDELEECVKTTSQARRCYLQALYSTSRLWRFFTLYAGHIWIYLIGFLSLILAFYVINIDEFIMSGSRMDNIANFAEAAIHATTWGAIGGILRGLWYLKDKVSERKYKNSFGPYFLSVPFLGAIFGAVVYLIIVAGLLSLGTGQSGDQQFPQINRPLVIIPICAIAGFNWEWVVIIFQRIEEAFSPNKSSTKMSM